MPTIPGGAEWLIILLIFVLLFGAKKLPELSRSVGQSITSFKKGVRDSEAEAEVADEEPSAEGEHAREEHADEPRDSA